MIISSSVTKDIGRILFWYPLRWMVLALPYSSLMYIAGFLGSFDYLFLQKDRLRRVGRAVQGAIGCRNSEANKIVKQNLIHHYANTLELIRYPGMDCQFLRRIIVCENRERLDTALERGSGVILMTAHFGAKQLLQIFLGREGYAINQINHHVAGTALTFVQQHVSQRLRKKIESRLPITFIEATSFQRKTLECLINNEILIVAGDGSGIEELVDASYKPYSFLGQNMLFPTGAGMLSARTGATIIPVFVIREGTGHRVIFEEPIQPQKSSLETDPIKRYCQELEKKVRSYPHLWDFWEEFEDGFLCVTESTA
ncbi:MAG: hypothetical protein CSA32_03545 [Desulfobulbus propionicus]|nr:MAG: hypothetical protein CSA32_03545 [Desulfobulbus propionicus]